MTRPAPATITPSAIRIATAGWSIPPQYAALFPASGSHLQRYAARFEAVEVNSSFYRPHRPDTWRRWAASVPAGFRFAVKVPKEITHILRLADAAAPLERFLSQAGALGEALGPLLVQLPPRLAFDPRVAASFFADLRRQFEGLVACEPRHASWFGQEATKVLTDARVARVAADPAVVPDAGKPGGWPGLVYWRLHGTPDVYYSAYDDGRIAALATRLRMASDGGADAWCVFDNTARGEAARNGLALRRLLETAAQAG
jgi:uncharacterized protein YecE (DUF72 family)